MKDKVILLVEDNPLDEVLTLRALKKGNVLNPVVVARDGAEALDYVFARNSYAERDLVGLPQLVLLDLRLPKIDGIDVLRQLRANESTKQIPVIVLTSSAEEQDLIRSLSLGAHSYMQKPVDFMELIDAVRQLGLFWLILNQNVPLSGRAPT